MTSKIRLLRAKSDLRNPTAAQISLGLFTFFCLLLILRNAEVAAQSMREGLALCAGTVIPSLFPFMVLSEIIAVGGVGRGLLRRLSKPLGRVLRFSEEGCCTYLLGTLCGFPIGTRYATVALGQGRMTQEEAERVIGIAGCPSSAFLISAVGVSLCQSVRFGIALYASVLFAAFITGIIFSRLPRTTQAFPPMTPTTAPTKRLDARLFCEAMRASAANILLICAYVVFFSALMGTFSYLPFIERLPEAVRTLLFCLFELSGGISSAAGLSSPITAALLCAFAAGWSGLSVHCQTLSLCDRTGLSLRPYLRSKLLQALLAPLILGLLLALFPSLLPIGG